MFFPHDFLTGLETRRPPRGEEHHWKVNADGDPGRMLPAPAFPPVSLPLLVLLTALSCPSPVIVMTPLWGGLLLI